MPGQTGLGGRDEPSRGTDDHAELLSELDSHDLATAMAVTQPPEMDAFQFDRSADPDTVFPQSIASGGPTPSGVILWTRIDPGRFDPDTPLGVQVAADRQFEDIVYDGVVTAAESIQAYDYTVKIDLDGQLDANSEYYYRFVYDGVASRTGRCQTLPKPTDSPDSLRLAVLACQNYLNGYFPAYHHVA